MAEIQKKKSFLVEKEVLKKSKFDTILFSNKISEKALNKKINKIINNILFYFVLVLLPKRIYFQHIIIEVNGKGSHKILSDEYNGDCLKTQIVNKRYNFGSKNKQLKLYFLNLMISLSCLII